LIILLKFGMQKYLFKSQAVKKEMSGIHCKILIGIIGKIQDY